MELILNGYITNDYDWHPALTYSPLYEWELCGGQSIPDSIQQYFNRKNDNILIKRTIAFLVIWYSSNFKNL